VTSQLLALSCNVHAHRQTGGAPVNRAWAQCCQGYVHCNVCGKTFPRPERVRWHVECDEHDVLADCASGDYSYHRHQPAAPHATQFALYPSTTACRVWLHVSLGTCMWGTQQAHSLFPAASAALPFGVQLGRSRAGQSSNGDQHCSIAACQLTNNEVRRFSL